MCCRVPQMPCNNHSSWKANLRMLRRLATSMRGPAAASFAAAARCLSSGSVDITAPLNFWASKRRTSQEKCSKENVYEPATGKLHEPLLAENIVFRLGWLTHFVKWTLAHAVWSYLKTTSCEAFLMSSPLLLIVRIRYTSKHHDMQTHPFPPLACLSTWLSSYSGANQIIWPQYHSCNSSQLFKHYDTCKGHVELPMGPG